jgi:osmotically inducible lipoprotein OsmB
MLLKRVGMWTAVAALVAGTGACAPLTHSQKGAAIGGVAGGALGYVVTGGPIGTIAGAALGGVIGAGAGRR